MTPSARIPRTLVASALAAMLLAAAAAPALAQSPGPGIAPAPQQPPSREDTSGLTADIFYRVILGDVALQRGEASLAARAYYEAARESRDPRLARRAAEVAFAARMRGLTQEAAKLWASIDPSAERPKQMLAALAVAGAARGEVAPIDPEIKARLEKALADAALTERGPGELFLELNRMARDAFDKRQVYELVRELAKPYPNSAEAHFAIALAAYNGGAPEGQGEAVTQEEIDRALAIKPDWERAALLKADVLSRKSPDDAIAYLAKYVAFNPEARSASGALAQLYVERKRYAEARAIFQRLWDGDRNAREFEFGVAVISMQMKDWTTAESLFNDLKKAGYGDNGAVELYLAQIAEERGNYDEAIERYKAVPDSERGWLAKLRVAAMMGKQGKVAEARKYLADLPAVTIEQRVQVRRGAPAPRRGAEARRRAVAQRVGLHAGRSHDAIRRGPRADRARAQALARRPVHPRQHGMGDVQARPLPRSRALPAPRDGGAPRRRDRRAPGRGAVGQGRARPRAGSVANAAQGDAGQRAAARDRPPSRALKPIASLRHALAAASVAALAACATAPPVPPVDVRVESRFAAQGRLSARRGSDAVAVHYDWRHAAATDEFDVATPLGQTVARMRRDASGVRVERPNEPVVEYRDWGGLTQSVLGVAIPVDGLASWLQGAPVPGGASAVERDDAGRPLVLRQQGWEIVYAYNDASARPSRLVMRYPGSEALEVRIVIDAFSAK